MSLRKTNFLRFHRAPVQERQPEPRHVRGSRFKSQSMEFSNRLFHSIAEAACRLRKRGLPLDRKKLTVLRSLTASARSSPLKQRKTFEPVFRLQMTISSALKLAHLETRSSPGPLSITSRILRVRSSPS